MATGNCGRQRLAIIENYYKSFHFWKFRGFNQNFRWLVKIILILGRSVKPDSHDNIANELKEIANRASTENVYNDFKLRLIRKSVRNSKKGLKRTGRASTQSEQSSNGEKSRKSSQNDSRKSSSSKRCSTDLVSLHSNMDVTSNISK